jgi:hypothetical protein
MKKRALILLSLTLVPCVTWAQESPVTEDAPAVASPASDALQLDDPAPGHTTAVLVHLKNGIVLEGTILTSDAISWTPGQPLSFTPQNGTSTTLNAVQIQSIRTEATKSPETIQAESVVEALIEHLGPKERVSKYLSPGGFHYSNVGKSRHLYVPSAIGLKKGQGYVSQKWVFTAAAVGVTDNLTLLAGTFTFFPPGLTIVGGKVSGAVAENVHITAGAEVFMTGVAGFRTEAAVGFGGITFGHDDRQITFSTGYMSIFNAPAIPLIVAGQFRLSDRVVLITENWYLKLIKNDPARLPTEPSASNLLITSVALRLLGGREDTRRATPKRWTSAGDPKYTWDFGFIVINQDRPYGPLPWIDFAWHFGVPDR